MMHGQKNIKLHKDKFSDLCFISDVETITKIKDD